MSNIIGMVLSIIYMGIVMVIAPKVEKFGKEYSRKFIHIMLSNWWIIAMFTFDNIIWASILPVAFIFINYASYKFNIIKSMEREESDGLGTVYYAISLFITVLVSYGLKNDPTYGWCPILIMGYGDGLASVIGLRIESKKYKIGKAEKSIAGSLTMLLVSVLLLSVYFCLHGVSLWYVKAIISAIIVTLIEAIGVKGTDNILVPVSALRISCFICLDKVCEEYECKI